MFYSFSVLLYWYNVQESIQLAVWILEEVLGSGGMQKTLVCVPDFKGCPGKGMVFLQIFFNPVNYFLYNFVPFVQV